MKTLKVFLLPSLEFKKKNEIWQENSLPQRISNSSSYIICILPYFTHLPTDMELLNNLQMNDEDWSFTAIIRRLALHSLLFTSFIDNLITPLNTQVL